MTDSKIGIDVSYWRSSGNRGIGTMTENLVKKLVETQGLKPVLFSNRREKVIERYCASSSLDYYVIPLPYPLYEQIFLPLVARAKQVDLFHQMGNTGSVFFKPAPASVITVCDTIFWEKSIFSWFMQGKYGNIYRSVIAKYQKRLGYHYSFISNFTKSCYLSGGIDAASLHSVIYLSGGVDDADFPLINQDFTENHYICAMGARDPRKNIAVLIKAFIEAKVYKKFNVKLKIFGFEDVDNFLTSVELIEQELGVNGVEMMGFQTDEEKKKLIQNSIGFVYLSKSEGFGIPIIEAEKLGKSCLVSSTTSCGEISGPYAFKVDPHNYDDILLALKEFAKIAIERLGNDVISNEIVQNANRFSWQRAASETARFYRLCLK